MANNSSSEEVKNALDRFLDAFAHLDFQRFGDAFAHDDDVTVILPGPTNRLIYRVGPLCSRPGKAYFKLSEPRARLAKSAWTLVIWRFRAIRTPPLPLFW